jgi:hypothetical protein
MIRRAAEMPSTEVNQRVQEPRTGTDQTRISTLFIRVDPGVSAASPQGGLSDCSPGLRSHFKTTIVCHGSQEKLGKSTVLK